MANYLKRCIYPIAGNAIRFSNYFMPAPNGGKICVFNPEIGTNNLGDHIIMRFCRETISECLNNNDFLEISTHRIPNAEEDSEIKSTGYRFVCGTNLLTSHIEENWNWRLPDGIKRKLNYRNVILLGVGWKEYQDECSAYTKMIYKAMLAPGYMHAVRDSYSEKKLKAAGINNVINTGCPTMWKLTPDFCRTIPVKKANDVITTITDYRRDPVNDKLMLETLCRNYQNVFLWPQGKNDEEYLESLEISERIILLPRTIEGYESKLVEGNIDYVGTRLHAGIFALNHRVRSLIIMVDNRAVEIAEDTHLPTIMRDCIADELEKRINMDLSTEIRINLDNINKFKSQFKK